MGTLTCTPLEPVGLDGADVLLECGQVRLVVPRLHVQDDRRLGDQRRFWK